MAAIDKLIEEIRRLSPAQRRQLMLRLRINGLLDVDEPLSDQNPLQIAPALGVKSIRVRQPKETPVKAPAPAIAPPLPAGVRLDTTPAGGKIVMGAPKDNADAAFTNSPHVMAPVPGQAPEKPILVVFDGGSKGNPGYGYGSYALEWPGQPQQIVRLQLGNSITNNEAEYDTLIMALEAILKKLHADGAAPNRAQLDIRGDSQLVIQQVLGAWKCNEDRLRRRRNKVQSLLGQFEHWRLQHHGREHSVEILGH